MEPTREQALSLLKRYNESQSLINHALSVEAVMRHFAKKMDEDEQKWGIIGLIHDLDYEQYPQEHCQKTKEILEKEGWPSDYIRAAISHGWQICTDVEPIEPMEKVLYTIDELTGLIYAACLMRPSKSILDLTVKSVKKKFKDKRFAAGVDRSLIEQGAQRMDLSLDEVIYETIEGMKTQAEAIGLQGNL